MFGYIGKSNKPLVSAAIERCLQGYYSPAQFDCVLRSGEQNLLVRWVRTPPMDSRLVLALQSMDGPDVRHIFNATTWHDQMACGVDQNNNVVLFHDQSFGLDIIDLYHELGQIWFCGRGIWNRMLPSEYAKTHNISPILMPAREVWRFREEEGGAIRLQKFKLFTHQVAVANIQRLKDLVWQSSPPLSNRHPLVPATQVAIESGYLKLAEEFAKEMISQIEAGRQIVEAAKANVAKAMAIKPVVKEAVTEPAPRRFMDALRRIFG